MDKRIKWNKTDCDFLINNYFSLGLSECAKILNKNKCTVCAKAKRLNLSDKSKSEKFTFDEDNLLIENYFEKGPKYCSKMLNRTNQSICHRAMKLKLKCKNPKANNVSNYTDKIIGNIQMLEPTEDRDIGGQVIWKCKCLICGDYFYGRGTRIAKNRESCGCLANLRLSNMAKSQIGDKHPNYNPELTDQEREDRRALKQYVDWQKAVLKKYNSTCQFCGQKRNPACHHLNGYKWCIEQRFDPNNGVVLCKRCHVEFHCIYGNKNNTIEQFENFKENYYYDNKLKTYYSKEEDDSVQVS
jgi:hypothetical protein